MQHIQLLMDHKVYSSDHKVYSSDHNRNIIYTGQTLSKKEVIFDQNISQVKFQESIIMKFLRNRFQGSA